MPEAVEEKHSTYESNADKTLGGLYRSVNDGFNNQDGRTRRYSDIGRGSGWLKNQSTVCAGQDERLRLCLDVLLLAAVRTESSEEKENGAIYSKKEDWAAYAIQDGNLITGQNPASSELVAEKLLESLK